MAKILDAHFGENLKEAAQVLRRGGLVAIPTETVYGLAADAFNPRAVARIFEVKKRPAFDPLIVHVAKAESLSLLSASQDARIGLLSQHFWPGPLTLVLPKKEQVPDLVSAGLPNVAVRVPKHSATLRLIELAATPLAAPSANLFGSVSPTTAEHVAAQLGGDIDLILDGGACQVGLESTVLSLLEAQACILRPGGVSREELEKVLGPVGVSDTPQERPLAPGQLSRHYATRCLLVLLKPGEKYRPVAERAGLLAFKTPAEVEGYVAVEVLSEKGDLAEAASRLFAALRRLEARNLSKIVAEPCPTQGLGLAIMNRLQRAAEKP